MSTRLIALAGLLALGNAAGAADADFVGKWDLTITQGRNVMHALLDIRHTDAGLVGFVEGGPVDLQVDGNRIAMTIDERAIRGGRLVRYLQGNRQEGRLAGTFGPDHEPTREELDTCRNIPLACTVPTGTWSAVPHAPTGHPDGEPVDLTGAWVIVGRPLYRYTSALNEAGREWQSAFDVTMDLPGQRCQPWGLVNSWGFRGFDPEIFQSDVQITMVQNSEVRRIYLDDRQPPDYTDWYPLGFSTGRWEGDTLVVETTYLQPSIREWMGDPVSENARVEERYTIDDEGYLVGVMTLFDPTYYDEPPIKRARWRRAPPDQIRFPTLCDPDSFYRQLYDDGLMDEYWRRGNRRY